MTEDPSWMPSPVAKRKQKCKMIKPTVLQQDEVRKGSKEGKPPAGPQTSAGRNPDHNNSLPSRASWGAQACKFAESGLHTGAAIQGLCDPGLFPERIPILSNEMRDEPSKKEAISIFDLLDGSGSKATEMPRPFPGLNQQKVDQSHLRNKNSADPASGRLQSQHPSFADKQQASLLPPPQHSPACKQSPVSTGTSAARAGRDSGDSDFSRSRPSVPKPLARAECSPKPTAALLGRGALYAARPRPAPVHQPPPPAFLRPSPHCNRHSSVFSGTNQHDCANPD